jgi:hypothetical protein
MATATLTVTVAARPRGVWRLRLVDALLRRRICLPGSLRWAIAGVSVELEVAGRRDTWRPDVDAFLESIALDREAPGWVRR